MEKEFIPYEQALALKELGFDEPCFSVYYNGEYHEHGIQNEFLHEKNECSAPLYQQAFRWFRKEYNLFVGIEVESNNIFYWDIRNPEQFISSQKSDSYEEAELACLKKLIEITKQK